MKTFAEFGIETGGRTGEIDVICPECSPGRKKSRVPCLSVNTDAGTWFCHHCGWAGGLGDKTRLELTTRLYSTPKKPPETNLSEKTLAYLKGRGITEEVIARNKVGEGMVWLPQIQGEALCIQFPYYRGATLVNIKHRDGRKNFRMEKGAERVLYGLNDLTDSAVIVEGEIDKLSLEVAGFPSCVSVPDGAPTPETKNYASKFTFLEADEKRLSEVKRWVIAVDADEPGARLEDELARRLGREKCFKADWPEGCKDANDVLVKHGAEKLRECIETAKPYPIKGVFTVLDLSQKIDRLYEHGWEKGVSTGWKALDNLYTVRPGEFTAVTGIPNSGKSNWIDALCVNLAKQHGWRFAMFSPENQPLEDHMARVMEKWAGMPFTDGPNERISREGLERSKEWVNDHFSWILPDDDMDWTIENVLQAAKELVFREGIKGLVIDPWNELESTRPEGMTETDYIGRALKHIRQFARRNGIHVWMVVHPTKLYRDKEGNYPVPTLYDCAGSAHWRNKADNGICIWRDLSDPHTRVVETHIQKIRFRQIGKIGMGELVYSWLTGSYVEGEAAKQIPAEVGRI